MKRECWRNGEETFFVEIFNLNFKVRVGPKNKYLIWSGLKRFRLKKMIKYIV